MGAPVAFLTGPENAAPRALRSTPLFVLAGSLSNVIFAILLWLACVGCTGTAGETGAAYAMTGASPATICTLTFLFCAVSSSHSSEPVSDVLSQVSTRYCSCSFGFQCTRRLLDKLRGLPLWRHPPRGENVIGGGAEAFA